MSGFYYTRDRLRGLDLILNAVSDSQYFISCLEHALSMLVCLALAIFYVWSILSA